MSLADQGMKVGLRALNRFAGLELLDRIGAREPAEKLLHAASKTSARTAARAGRTFAAVQKRGTGARLGTARSAGLFDLTATDEQEMLRDSFRSFAAERVRHEVERAEAADDMVACPIDQDEAAGVADRERVKDHLIDERVDGGGGSDSEGECDDRRRSDSWRLS